MQGYFASKLRATFSPADPFTQLQGARGLCSFASSGCFLGSRAAALGFSRASCGSSFSPEQSCSRVMMSDLHPGDDDFASLRRNHYPHIGDPPSSATIFSHSASIGPPHRQHVTWRLAPLLIPASGILNRPRRRVRAGLLPPLGVRRRPRRCL